MTSIIIPAHNEGALIGGTLDALMAEMGPAPRPDIVVVANGCSDDTAMRASRPGVRVIEVGEAAKSAALNAAERSVCGFPRIYLDADIAVPRGAVDALVDALRDGSGVHAAVPRRRLNLSGRPWPVRAYFAINQELPAFRNGLFGRGLIALSETGRSRFDVFPDMVADDLFLDSLFDEHEKVNVAAVEVVVEAPWRTSDLVRRLVRVRRGNAAMRSAAASGQITTPVRAADRWAWLRCVVARDLRLAPAAAVYVILTAWAALQAHRTGTDADRWERDESTRVSQP